ncbi:hypothetical protein EUTSA_v10005703mg [Eutrema salsugineum]|uniref:F-box domain-containing protein n=1 Tax=Eutrema salsugineum TaxID=72664 RepID=V4K612_EUTSA|nr:hypothetical protein EUTSA_v10005703mg [Eutrema salsugineum]
MDARVCSRMDFPRRKMKLFRTRYNRFRRNTDVVKVSADMKKLSTREDLIRESQNAFDLMRKIQKKESISTIIRDDWSKLNPDVLRKILETLNPIDLARAKTVCSDWYFVSKTCFRPPGTSLQIIHQGEDSSSRQDKMINARTKPVGFCYKSYCMASSGTWLLMVDFRLHFHLLNLITRESIDLPSMDSPIRGGQVRFEPGGQGSYDDKCGYFVESSGNKSVDILPSLSFTQIQSRISTSRKKHYYVKPSGDKFHHVSKDIVEWKNSAVVWINETTGDYVVAWIFRQHYLFSYKKGDASWSNLTLIKGTDSGFLDVAYRYDKLFVFTTDQQVRIFDFSGDFPDEVIANNPYWDRPFGFVEQPWEYVWKRKICIQKSGEVLVILSLKEVKYEEKLLFYVFKLNLESGKWERVDSIGDDDEMLILGHGVTVRAPVGDGIFKSDSICFVEDDVWPDQDDEDDHHGASKCGVFNIATRKIEWHKKMCFI